VRRHVVVAFHVVPVCGIAVRRPALHQHFEIAPDAGIGVLGNRQAATGVAHENMGNADLDRCAAHDGGDVVGDFDGAAAMRVEGEVMLLGHYFLSLSMPCSAANGLCVAPPPRVLLSV